MYTPYIFDSGGMRIMFKAIGKKVADGVADGTIDKIKPYTPYIVLGGVILLGVLILSRQPRVVVVLAR